MADIIHFKPKHELDAEKNLSDFIFLSKNKLTVFGENLGWNSIVWKGQVSFTKLGTKSRGWTEDDVLHESFIEFAKAYFRYQQGMKPTKTKNEMKALRCLESALLAMTSEASIHQVSPAVFDLAAQRARENLSIGGAYQAGNELVRLAEFLVNKNLIPTKFSWVSPNKKEKDPTIAVGRKAEQRRQEKMPQEEALMAAGEIFNLYPDLSPKNIFGSSICAMLMAAPERISELLNLPVNALTYDIDKNGKSAVGFRWFAGKGYGAEIKWIPDVYVSIIEEAIERVATLTLPARKLAQWLEEKPDLFPRHENCPDVDEGELLTLQQVFLALGFDLENKNIRSSVKNQGLKTGDFEYSLRTLNVEIRKKLPKDFPIFDKDTNLKWSNALFAMRQYEVNNQRITSAVKLFKPSNNTAGDILAPSNPAKVSMFVEHGYGADVKLKTHQPRHKLNTDARKGGMTDTLIAKWSGRADKKQNRHYNHTTTDDMMRLARKADSSLSVVSEFTVNTPSTIQEFNLMTEGTAHVTEFGYCVHDYIMSPCQKFRDCLNCSDQVCVKGDDKKLKHLKSRKVLESQLFVKAQKALDEGDYGADKWYENKKKTLNRLNELIGIMEDDNIENDSLIRLHVPDEHTPLKRALEAEDANEKLEIKSKSISKLLGGF